VVTAVAAMGAGLKAIAGGPRGYYDGGHLWHWYAGFAPAYGGYGYPPEYYAPPPVYYAPPPAYYAPPAYYYAPPVITIIP
jgi:hypothetical protein